MQITEVKIRHQNEEGKLRAMVSVTFDGVFAVHDIKIIQGTHRLFLAMPSRKLPDGRFRDIVHPIGEEMRNILEQRVLEEYNISNGK